MEKLRDYDLEGLSRANKLLYHAKKRLIFFTGDLSKEPTYTKYIRQNETTILASAMMQKHKDWVASKMEPLFPYLQSGTINQEQQIDTKNQATEHYNKGLTMTMRLLSKPSIPREVAPVDIQDAITSYTISFINILRACERLALNPDTALLLAQKAYGVNARTLTQLVQDNNIPLMAVDRAAIYVRPEYFLKRYAKAVEMDNPLLEIERYYDFSINDPIPVNEIPEEPHKPSDFIRKNPELQSKNILRIEGVPILKQKHVNWCGITSLSMIFKYYGLGVSPEDIFKHTNGEYHKILEYLDPGRGPSIDTLALAAQELTPLKARVITENDFKKIKEKRPDMKTPQDLLKTYIKGGIPCIVRMPGHFMVVKGVDIENGSFIVNDPGHGGTERRIDANNFNSSWSQAEPNYPRDARYLMLAIFPQKK